MVSPAAAPLWAACRVVKSAEMPPTLLFTRQILAKAEEEQRAKEKRRTKGRLVFMGS